MLESGVLRDCSEGTLVFGPKNGVHYSHRCGTSGPAVRATRGARPAPRLIGSGCRAWSVHHHRGMLEYSSRAFVKVLLKASEDLANLLRLAQICDGIGNRVVVF